MVSAKNLFFCFSHTSVSETQIYKDKPQLKTATIEYNLFFAKKKNITCLIDILSQRVVIVCSTIKH
jgi:hypothetical protein